METKNGSSFSGQIGFVLAAAGSAVGVGNLWRFPYLAAKDGGGLFLLVYLILILTFGFTLLTSDIAIGRKTKKSAIFAYEKMREKWRFLGILTFFVPVMIMTYYAVIGGWITKYFIVFITGQGRLAASDGYFTQFITSPQAPVFFSLFFMILTAFIVYNGVESGIEKCSKIVMPILLVMIVAIAVYSLTLTHTDGQGHLRTGIEGLQ
ncbi:MAG: sodium-dependent transporter, partial [Erysipelotrichaceae bacterium]|nr:sodium-dependent transporter [Erysipelotrichaceae bacterium]